MIHSDGVEVENLLPSTGSPTVRLLRRLWHPTTWQGDSTPNTAGYISLTSWTYAMGPASDMNLVTHEVGRANWWIPSKEVAQSPNVRHFEGEIHLSPELQPSCDFQHFRIEVPNFPLSDKDEINLFPTIVRCRVVVLPNSQLQT